MTDSFIFVLDFEFSLVRLASMAVGCLFVLIGSLAAWSNHEGVGAQQAAGAFGALAGICYGVLTFFAFQMRKEELEKRANEGKSKINVLIFSIYEVIGNKTFNFRKSRKESRSRR